MVFKWKGTTPFEQRSIHLPSIFLSTAVDNYTATMAAAVARTFSSLVVCVEDTGHIYGRVHTTRGEDVCTHAF